MDRTHTLILLLSSALISLFTGCNYSGNESSAIKNDTIPPAQHWEKAIPNQQLPPGLASLKARDCGACHTEIYNEWRQSTHAMAFKDLQFQAEWQKDNVSVCLNCHTPLQNQQEYIVTGFLNGNYETPVKQPNPHFDQSLQQEGINCAGCHVRAGAVIAVNDNPNSIHKTVKDAEFLSEKLCISCHNAVAQLNEVLVCTFETGDEWQNNWAAAENKNCISCHMVEKERAIVVDGAIRKSRYHRFPGSGIPKFYNMAAEGLNGLEIIADTPSNNYAPDDKLVYTLTLKNSFAGHKVPTGDPERFFLINFILTGEDGRVLHQEVHRIGEQWQWFPEAKQLAENNLKPLESRVYEFVYDFMAPGRLKLVVEIEKHRITEENARYNGILADYPLSISAFRQEYSIEVNR
jgi:nitrate/TMAO reductase-like tetraheme cytochrome c subunit